MLQPFYMSVDFKQKSQIREPIVTQYDDLIFVITVNDNGTPAVIDGLTYRFVSRRPDNKSYYVTGVKSGDNEITFDLGKTEVSLVGKINAAVQLFDSNNQRLSSFTFNYTVTEDISLSEELTSQELTLLEYVVQEGPGLVDYFSEKQPLIEKFTNDQTSLQSEIDGLTTQMAESASNFKSTASNETAQLGAELLDATGWTTTGWTGDFNTGFVHIAGQTTPLTKVLPSTGTKSYQVSLTVTASVAESPPGNFTVSIGGSQTFDTYKGAGTSPYTYSYGIQSVSDGNLIITPISSFNGTITNISVKEIITPTTATQSIKDSTNVNSLEIRPTQASLKNVFMGIDAGKMNTTGDSNTIIGNGSMVKNTSGFWNSSLGADTLANNTVGSRNIAVGRVSLQNNITGHRNIAVGTFALNANTHGTNNVGVGADTLFVNTTGSGNVGISTTALYSNTTGSHNIGLGYPSLQRNTSGNYNIALGTTSLDRNITGNGNVAIGKNAGERVNADNNIAIGQYALNWVTTTQNSIAIGYQSQQFTTTGVNISIGANSLANTTTGTDNVGMGDNALKNNTTGIRNIAIGNNAGQGATGSVINRNILIGHNVGAGMTTGADQNVIIGSSSGNPLTTGANNILIGYAVNTFTATDNNFLNIGNAIKGWLDTKKFGIGIDTISATLHLKGGSTVAGSAPLKLNSGSLMTTAEAGAIEFDGTDLYITTSGGVRKKITAA